MQATWGWILLTTYAETKHDYFTLSVDKFRQMEGRNLHMNGRTHISSLKELWVVTDLQPLKKNSLETLSLWFEDEDV